MEMVLTTLYADDITMITEDIGYPFRSGSIHTDNDNRRYFLHTLFPNEIVGIAWRLFWFASRVKTKGKGGLSGIQRTRYMCVILRLLG